jgi:ATP-dependent exoDNAse (exonuclease V) alpha subunit
MAIYFLNLKTFGRSSGSSAVNAAAYRAGERIRDERTGRLYDHSNRQDVLHKEIILPDKFSADDMTWAKDRNALWNAAELSETRKNARVAREYLVALPHELPPQSRIELAREFTRELVERYGFAADVAIHEPRNSLGSDQRNFHAHILATTREVTSAGLGAKTPLEWNDADRREVGLEPVLSELLYVRQRWALVTNERLQDANLAGRIDHRTLEAQGIDREPFYIPRVAYEMERQGYRSVVAERIRTEHQARAEARLERSSAQRSSLAAESKDPEEIRRQARENWLRMRQGHGESAPELTERSQEAAERTRDDGLDLNR